MTRYQMAGRFWRMVGLTTSYNRAFGSIPTTVDPTLYETMDEGILEMVSRARPVLCRSYNSFTLNGASSYSLPSDFIDYWGVNEPIRIAGKALQQVQYGDIDSLVSDPNYSSANQSTSYWYELGVSSAARKIAFYPVPTSGTAIMPYLRKPATLGSLAGNSTEYTDIPARFHLGPVLWAAYEWAQQRKERVALTNAGIDPEAWMARFDGLCEQLKQETSEELRRTMRGTIPDMQQGAVELWMEV